MKKYIVIALLGLLATSCQDVYEKAYEAECLYKAKKAEPELVRGSLKGYKAEFMSIYESMTKEEQERYKSYRKRKNEMNKIELAQLKRVQAEAIEMLNE